MLILFMALAAQSRGPVPLVYRLAPRKVVLELWNMVAQTQCNSLFFKTMDEIKVEVKWLLQPVGKVAAESGSLTSNCCSVVDGGLGIQKQKKQPGGTD